MPHYKNGELARVGDIVVGSTYNRPGEQIGVVCQIKEGQDTCNAVVALGLSVLSTGYNNFLLSPSVDNQGNPQYDYTDCGKLLRVKSLLEFYNSLETPKCQKSIRGLRL